MNQVTEKKSAPLPANIFEEDAAKGLGNIGQQDLALPFLKILGQLSPEVNKRDGKYVEGAEPGMIYNSVSGDLYDGVKGIDVIPCFYKLEYIEWKDRGEGLVHQLQSMTHLQISYLRHRQMQTTKIDYRMVIMLKELHLTLSLSWARVHRQL